MKIIKKLREVLPIILTLSLILQMLTGVTPVFADVSGPVLDQFTISPLTEVALNSWSHYTSTNLTPTISAHVNDAAYGIVLCQYRYITDNSPDLSDWKNGTFGPDTADNLHAGTCSSPSITPTIGATKFGGEIKITDSYGLIADSDLSQMYPMITDLIPLITVTSVTSDNSDPLPTIQGTINDPTAIITVYICDISDSDCLSPLFNAQAANNGDGTWSVPVVDIYPVDGTYSIKASANNGNSSGTIGYASGLYTVTIMPTITSLIFANHPGTVNGNTISIDLTGITQSDLDTGGTIDVNKDSDLEIVSPVNGTLNLISGTNSNTLFELFGYPLAITPQDIIDIARYFNGVIPLTGTLTDATGNITPITINISVDVAAPVITLKGHNPMTVEYGSIYIEPGATWTDNYDGLGTVAKVNISNIVSTFKPGSYTIEYIQTDAAGNTGRTTRIVNVLPKVVTTKKLPAALAITTADFTTPISEPGTSVSPVVSDSDVLGTQTTNTNTDNSTAKPATSPFAYTLLGIYDWIWILTILVGLSILWYLATDR